MAVSFKAMLMPHQAKADGSNFVRIRVTHQRKSKYLRTNIVILPEDLTRSGKIKSQTKLDLVDDLIRRMRSVTSGMDMFRLKCMTVDEVVRYIDVHLSDDEDFRLDFIEFGNCLADKKKKSTGDVYRVALNALVRFFSGRHPDISEITVRNLRRFEEFIINEPVVKVNWRTGVSKEIKKSKGRRAVSQYMASIRHIYKSARIEYNDPDLGRYRIPSDPFEHYSVPRIPASRHRDLPISVIQLMIDSREHLTGRKRMAVDAFLISFGLCGMNAADMMTCEKDKKGIVHYYRTKTADRRDDGAEVYIRIEPCIRKIMKDYKGKDRLFDFSNRYSSAGTFTTALNQGLKAWSEAYKQESFTFYAARHSWATIGRSAQCNVATREITAGLAHVDSDNKMNDVYARYDWHQLFKANKTILGVFDWK